MLKKYVDWMDKYVLKYAAITIIYHLTAGILLGLDETMFIGIGMLITSGIAIGVWWYGKNRDYPF